MSGGNKPATELKTWIRRPILLSQWRKQLLFERYFKLSHALCCFHGSKATLWQDKIFAFVGFTDLTERLSEIIEYTLPKDAVLLTLANYFLKQEGGLLDTFPFAGLAALEIYPTNLPTWVADWTSTRRIVPISSAEHLGYKASGEEYYSTKQGDSEREIIIHGLIFDKISEVSEVDLDFTPDGGTIRSSPVMMINKAISYFTSAVSLARKSASDPYNPFENMNQPLDEAVCRTMFGDATRKTRPANAEYKDVLSKFIDHGKFIVSALEGGKFTLEDIHPLPWRHGAYYGEWWREDEIRTLMQQIDNVRWLCGSGRRFCVTEKRFIGMVPRVARPGDLVCLLFGSPVPMILRRCPSNDKYQLVGEAYGHGIMAGEGMNCEIPRHDFTIV
jgi:hypothetical protein